LLYFYSYLEYAAYPVISPNNSSFPINFVQDRITQIFINQTIGGDNLRSSFSLKRDNPYAGIWFSAAFLLNSGFKNKTKKINNNCSHFLSTSIKLVKLKKARVLYINQLSQIAFHQYLKFYKYYTGEIIDAFVIEFSHEMYNVCSITTFLRQSALPDMINMENNDDNAFCVFDNHKEMICNVGVLNPLAETWYYLSVRSNCFYKINLKSPAYKCKNIHDKQKGYKLDIMVIQ
jgi:hypothetical protein